MVCRPIIRPQSMTPERWRQVTAIFVKDPKRRLRDIGDARLVLDGPIDRVTSSGVRAAPVHHPLWRWALPWVVGTVAGTVVAALISLAIRDAPVEYPVVRFAIDFPPGEYSPPDWGAPVAFAVSPDGDRIVYTARRNGVDRLYSRRLDDLEAHAIDGTEGANGPFFSPDGQWVGFFADRALKKIPLAGGTPITICPALQVTGASWAVNGQIVFSAWGAPVTSVSADGGTPQPVKGLC